MNVASSNAVRKGDTTQIDQPDTPAPVFAARAFKSALFGTPAARPMPVPQAQQPKPSKDAEEGSRTPPSKPQGILLTPGTGTSRPKRVSFGREVKGTKSQSSLATKLGAGLSNAQQPQKAGKGTTKSDANNDDADDDEWEEEDDDDPENYCNHDITVDLNEPQSQSGKFWKDQFEKYRGDAQVELDKMLKYKQLAKSYAQLKDAEAIDLAEKLKEEQQKVVKMEQKISENASQIVAQNDGAAEDASPDLIRKLTKQTALAIQHKQRVQELEEQLEDLMEDRNNEAESTGRRRLAPTSPRTQRTLLETQRELRKARNQVKELNSLREQVSDLQDKLRAAEKRAAKAEQTPATEGTESSRAKDLRAQLRTAQEESKIKDEEIQQLKKDFDAYREERTTHEQDSKAVLERAHNKIADLKKEIKVLKASNQERPARPTSWHPQSGKLDLELETAELDLDAPVKVYARRAKREENKAGEDVAERRTAIESDKGQTLRDKFRHDGPSSSSEAVRTTTMSGALGDRPILEKPRWQPFVPRSPRNRDYLGEDLANKIHNGGITPKAGKSDDLPGTDLPALAMSIAQSDRRKSRSKAEPKIDLLTDRFVKLGGPDMGAQPSVSSTHLSERTVKSRLPPERQAAAMARIEKRRAEKKLQRQQGADKENVQPF